MATQIFSLLPWVSLAAAAATGVRPGCSDVTFTISATSESPFYSVAPDAYNETDIINFVHAVLSGTVLPALGTEPVSGTFSINGVYCRPAVAKPDDVLQILVHGITYNQTMWSGMGFGDYYNYHKFANFNGYHTLAIDRLGHGSNSEHPDPFGVVGGAIQVEIMHQLIGLVKGNSRGNPLGRTFNKIAYVSCLVPACRRPS